eukprot:c8077_g2_i1 orf=3-263(-)
MWSSRHRITNALLARQSISHLKSLQTGLLAAPMHVDACTPFMQQVPDMLSLEDMLITFEKTVGPPSIESCIFILQMCRKQKNLAYAE